MYTPSDQKHSNSYDETTPQSVEPQITPLFQIQLPIYRKSEDRGTYQTTKSKKENKKTDKILQNNWFTFQQLNFRKNVK